MKKYHIIIIIAAIIILCLGTSREQKNLLKKVDALASYTDTDFSAQYTITQTIPGEGVKKTVAAVFRCDAKNIYTILILEPSVSKGEGYLKQGDTLWFYDPQGRVFNSTSSKDRFQNSNARNSDFTRSTLAEDYDVIAETAGKLGQYRCRILDLEANSDDVTYPYMKIWVSEDNLVRKTEDYSLSKQLLRTTLVPKYNKIKNRYVPNEVIIIDQLLGAVINGKFENETTRIKIEMVSFKDVPNRVFSKNFLETMSVN
ncbi:MAG: outer membrane lipoprotein-sorting protein [Spirochaetales bacterium]|nr:outer membrane lipoprotein-sorting protein [Spirochaetales bacterium]